MLEDLKKDATARMQKCVQSFQADLKKLRTGRAHPSLVEHPQSDPFDLPAGPSRRGATRGLPTLPAQAAILASAGIGGSPGPPVGAAMFQAAGEFGTANLGEQAPTGRSRPTSKFEPFPRKPLD